MEINFLPLVWSIYPSIRKSFLQHASINSIYLIPFETRVRHELILIREKNRRVERPLSTRSAAFVGNHKVAYAFDEFSLAFTGGSLTWCLALQVGAPGVRTRSYWPDFDDRSPESTLDLTRRV